MELAAAMAAYLKPKGPEYGLLGDAAAAAEPPGARGVGLGILRRHTIKSGLSLSESTSKKMGRHVLSAQSQMALRPFFGLFPL